MLASGLVTLLVHLLFASRALAIGVLFPLYAYPLDNCVAWNDVNAAISSHSSTQWYIIVNPNSGPGETDLLYQGCVASLASANNRITMGYLDTTTGHVQSDIDKYAAWPSTARPNGIYFDPVEPTADRLSTYEGYINYAKSKGFSFIGLAPGKTTPESYIALADLVNTYESTYNAFNADDLTGTLSKQSVNIGEAPSSGSYSAVIERLQSKGIKAVYISNEPDTSQKVPVQLNSFVSEVAAASGAGGGAGNGGGSSSSGGSNGSGGGSSDSSNGSSGSNSNPSSLSGQNSATKGGAGGAQSGSKTAAGSIETGGSSPSGSSSSSSGASGSDNPNAAGGSGSNTTLGSSQKHGPSTAAIVGGVLGALVVVLLLVIAAMCLRKRRRRADIYLASDRREAGIAPFAEVRATTVASFSASPEGSSIGAPSRAWAGLGDIKTPLAFPTLSPVRSPIATTTSPTSSSNPNDTPPTLPIPLPPRPIPDESSASPQTRTTNRASLLSSFSSWTATTVPTYYAAPAVPVPVAGIAPPPAYTDERSPSQT